MEAVVIALFVLLALSGVVIGRWWTLILPIVVWPVYFLGLARDWWGHGMGDGWQYGAVMIVAASVTLTALGVALHSRFRSRVARLAS
jgi:hypothetical protein